MSFKNIRTIFYAALTASPMALFVSYAAEAQETQAVVKYTHPVGTPLVNAKKPRSTEPTVRTVNCGSLYRPPSNPNQLFLTPKFFSEVDIENGNIGKPIDLTRPEREVISALTLNTQQWLQHMAVAHEQCRAQYVNLHKRISGGVPPYDSKPEWENQRHCPVQDVVRMCQAEMGLK